MDQSNSQREIRNVLALSIPICVGNLGDITKFLIDMVIIGRLGPIPMTAAGLSVDSLYVFLMLPLGMLSMLGISVSNAVGTNADGAVRNVFQHGILASLILSVPSTIVCLVLPYVFILFHQNSEIIDMSRDFTTGLAIGVPALLPFAVCRRVLSATGHASASMVLVLAGVLINVPTCLFLMYGYGGWSGLGLFGAGLSTSLINFALLFATLSYFYFSGLEAKYGLLRLSSQIRWREIRKILASGLAPAFTRIFEYSAYLACTFFIGVIDSDSLAASLIILNVVFIVSIVAYGMGEAGAIRIAYWQGKSDPYAAKRSGILSLVILLPFSALFGIFLTYSPLYIVGAFIDVGAPSNFNVVLSFVSLCFIGAVFQFFDVTQSLLTRLLRGYGDTMASLCIVASVYWIIGVGGSVFSLLFDLGVTAMWISRTSAVLVIAILTGFRYLNVANSKRVLITT